MKYLIETGERILTVLVIFIRILIVLLSIAGALFFNVLLIVLIPFPGAFNRMSGAIEQFIHN